MILRSIKLLLLATLLAWATGAAQFVHERLEHADGEDISPLAIEPAQSAATPSPDSQKTPPHHSRDDCPTCQLLAHMTATPFSPQAPICLRLPALERVVVCQDAVLATEPIPFAPIRGPPAA